MSVEVNGAYAFKAGRTFSCPFSLAKRTITRVSDTAVARAHRAISETNIYDKQGNEFKKWIIIDRLTESRASRLSPHARQTAL